MTIEPGLKAEMTYTVTDKDTAASYGSGFVPVLSTPHLIALIESTSQKALAPHLAEGQSAVGVSVDMKHLAATPVGMEVRIEAEVTAVDRRKVTFKVTAWDAVEKIGEADHERFIIDEARFLQRVEEKRNAS